MHTTAAAATLAATLAIAATIACVSGERLNDYVANYEKVTIHPMETLAHGRYTREKYLHQKPFSFELSAFDQTFSFDLQPHTNLHSKNLKVMVFDGDKKSEVSLNDRKYYYGYVNDDGSQFCHFRVADDGSVHGYFNYQGDKYAVDPASFHIEGAETTDHVVYRLSDHDYVQQPPKPAHCGVVDVPEMTSSEEERLRSRRAAFDSSKTVCDIGIVADSKFYTTIGSSDISRTIDKMTQRFANVEEVYEEFNDVTDDSGASKIGISIGYIEVIQSTSTDPYNAGQNFNQDGEEFLRHFSSNPNADNSGVAWDDFCLVHCLTNQEFDEGLLGLAWVGSKGNSPGGICQEGATLSGDFLYTNTGFSTQTNFGERVPDLTAYLVMSHELGHNFGSSHDSEEQSSGGQFLMWPVSVDGTEDNNYLFSPQSLSVIGEVITAKGGCFIASDEPTCGNGVQEGSEPCDCGGNPSLCSQFDSCCEIGCTLASGAECSPQNTQNGTCCTSGCQKITDTSTVCREEQVCTEQSTCTADGECPTPANRPDSTLCASHLLCNSGSCTRSICELWDLEEASDPTGNDPCLVFCDPSNPRTTDELGPPTNSAQEQDGSPYVYDSNTPVQRDVASFCMQDDFSGQCDENGECVSINGNFYFDKIENFLKGVSLNDIKDWALRTDAYIPNYGWILVGVGILIVLVSLCCCISNKQDAKNHVT